MANYFVENPRGPSFHNRAPVFKSPQPIYNNFHDHPSAKMLDPRTALSPEAAPFTPTPMSYTSESARAAAGAQYYMPSPSNFGNPYSGQYREYSTRSPYPGQYTEYSTRSPASPALRGSPVRRVSPQVAASLKIPSPTKEYLVLSNEPLRTNSLAKPLLLIIDLNGTLLHRPRRQARPQDFDERPFTKSFLKYALSNHVVMIWSSARPENVSAMCRKLFPQGDGAGIIAQWSRDHLGLTSMEYHSKVQVYKRLEKVWADTRIQATYPEADVTFDPFGEGRWNQTNTVLIDDTAEKAKGQPFNLIQIPEFVGKNLEDDTVLPVLIDYLQAIKYQANVSAYMRKEPFNYQKLKAVYSAPDYPSYDEQSTEGEGAGTVRDVKFTAFSAGDEKVIGKGKGKEGEVLIRDTPVKGGGQNPHPVSWAAVNRMDVEFTTSGKGAGTVRDSGFDTSSVLDKKALDMAKAKAEQEFIQSIHMGLNKDEISLSRTYNWTAVNSSVANPVPETINKADVEFSISSEIVREVEFTTSSVGNEKAIDKGKGKEQAGVEFTTSVDTDMDRDNGETLLPRMYNGPPAYGSLPNPVPATTYNAETQLSTSSAPMPQGPLEPGATQDNPMPISSDVSFSDDDSEDDEDGGVPLPPYDDYAQGYAHGIGKNGGGGGGGARGDDAGGY